ncbi:hypothetical protein N7478_013195 [Penicillium angulare]|uniref:uncharacterized protein n=1 Tax=Penicillium angulare TaxID=116970 RepID=UPI002540FE60|nr:uncharacterized protein N7478_013195 [Penicillium angulare]KAJ5257091.1 hypothetical protein N7478_013195 [Penicillium angulare]
MRIVDLPSELLYLIGSDLNQEDIRNLISTSHQMHSLFQRKPYTKVILKNQNASTAQIFLYTVARNPELAACVKSLALAGWETSEDSDLEEVYDDAWLALLIPRLTGLRKTGFEWPFGSSHVIKMLCKAAINGGNCLPHLEEVSMCWYDMENAVDSYQMHPFFEFPSVRKVSGWKVAESAKEEEEEEEDFELVRNEILKDVSLPPRCSNIMDIDLSETNAAEGMREWIQACKTLKFFRIIHGGGLISYDDLQPRKLYNSLSLHKSTLEAIWVEADEHGSNGNNDDEGMGSFVDFSALKLLRLSLYNLIVFDDQGSPTRKISDVIPSSLEILFLDIAWEGFCDALKDLADIATSGKFSKIAALHIETSNELSSPEKDEKVEWLQHRCREVGVACHIYNRRSRDYWEDIRLWHSLWTQCEAEDLTYSC